MITYYFNNLHPQDFQRLINALLVCKFGENIRLTPIKGKDGGRDGETAIGNPNFPYVLEVPGAGRSLSSQSPGPGRYLFQVKHHSTINKTIKEARNAVVADFRRELKENVLNGKKQNGINYFFLLTNVSSSPSSLNRIDEIRQDFQSEYPNLHADVWWSEHITALLDIFPRTWSAFPAMFAGNRVPMLSAIAEPNSQDEGIPAAIKLALAKHFKRDSRVKFQQIDLENDIFKLFVDLEVTASGSEPQIKAFIREYWDAFLQKSEQKIGLAPDFVESQLDFLEPEDLSAVTAILAEPQKGGSKLIVEGGPGQGKSTVTQVVAQIHRSLLLNRNIENTELPRPLKLRIPLRIELRYLAEWINSQQGSLEQYICHQISTDSGGNTIEVKDFHRFSKETRLLLIFDGLDEIGSDELRNKCVTAIEEGLERLTENLKADLQIVITTRPPAFSNFANRFSDYLRLRVQPMNESTIQTYVNRWLEVQSVDAETAHQIRRTYSIRSKEPHVNALARNPMQLSVLLHFMRLKGEAFPSRRAELYQDYFKVVIDRDVAKTPELAPRREIVEYLHEFLGYKIHALSEAEKTDGSISYGYLIKLIDEWLENSGEAKENASDLLKVGEERLGLLVAIKGEGESTHYGFEIQPIREYFAAAYISNQYSGDAHECFQELVIRQFWREVALFLAGLRRSNEKADLIYRLLLIDEKYRDSFERPGIEILLPLSEEGIFDRPPTLFNHAIQELLKAAEPGAGIRCYLANNFFERLARLIVSRRQPKIQTMVKSIRDKCLELHDDSATIIASNLASKVLDEADTKEFIKNLPELHPKTACILKLVQPVNSQLAISDLTEDPEFWAGASDDIWQNFLWRMYRLDNQITQFRIPDHLYSGMLSIFASDRSPSHSLIRGKNFGADVIVEPPAQIHAVWLLGKLTDLLDLGNFSNQLYEKNISEKLISFTKPIIDEKTNILDYGLDSSLSEACQKLIELNAKILYGIGRRESQDTLKNLVREELAWLQSSLKACGIVSLIVARALSTILMSCFVNDHSERQHAKNTGQRRLIIKALLEEDECFLNLVSSITEFAPGDGPSKDALNPGLVLNFLQTSVPINCRLSGSNSLVSINQARLKVGLNEKDPDYHWLKTIPLDQNSVLELVNGKTGEELVQILRFIGKSSFSFKGLFRHDAKRVAKGFRPNAKFSETAARFREMPGVPSGYLLAQLTSQNLGNADYSLLKAGAIERYDNHRQCLVSQLFDTSSIHLHGVSKLGTATLKVLDRLAKDIVSESEWPMTTVRKAIYFLQHDKQTEHPPLIDLESKLGF